MELVINLGGGLRGEALEKRIELFKNAGFTAMDFGLFEMSKDDSTFLTDRWQEEARGIREITDRMGFPVVQAHAPFVFTSEQNNTPELFESVVVARVSRSIEIAGILGAKIIIVHPLQFLPYCDCAEQLFEMNMDYYRRLIPVAAKAGVKIAVENMFQRDPRRKHIVPSTCARPEEMIRYHDTLNSEWITCCLDVGHVGLPVQYIEAYDFARALGHDRLQSLHIHDNDYQQDRHTLPYLGIMDWAEICKALGEIDYQGDFTFEVGMDLVKSKDESFHPIGARFMADVGKHLMEMIDSNRPKG